MKNFSYAFLILILTAGTASAAEYYIYRDYSGRMVLTNQVPPSSARIVVTYELSDSASRGPGGTIESPIAAETKEPDKAADVPAVAAPHDRR